MGEALITRRSGGGGMGKIKNTIELEGTLLDSSSSVDSNSFCVAYDKRVSSGAIQDLTGNSDAVLNGVLVLEHNKCLIIYSPDTSSTYRYLAIVTADYETGTLSIGPSVSFTDYTSRVGNTTGDTNMYKYNDNTVFVQFLSSSCYIGFYKFIIESNTITLSQTFTNVFYSTYYYYSTMCRIYPIDDSKAIAWYGGASKNEELYFRVITFTDSSVTVGTAVESPASWQSVDRSSKYPMQKVQDNVYFFQNNIDTYCIFFNVTDTAIDTSTAYFYGSSYSSYYKGSVVVPEAGVLLSFVSDVSIYANMVNIATVYVYTVTRVSSTNISIQLLKTITNANVIVESYSYCVYNTLFTQDLDENNIIFHNLPSVYIYNKSSKTIRFISTDLLKSTYSMYSGVYMTHNLYDYDESKKAGALIYPVSSQSGSNGGVINLIDASSYFVSNELKYGSINSPMSKSAVLQTKASAQKQSKLFITNIMEDIQ